MMERQENDRQENFTRQTRLDQYARYVNLFQPVPALHRYRTASTDEGLSTGVWEPRAHWTRSKANARVHSDRGIHTILVPPGFQR